MTTYIGTAIPRVDGEAKVTGAAKYAGEFNVPGLAYGAVVTSTIAKGNIAHIDASAAAAVEGVLSVLTHENRPPMAEGDSAYKDDIAPEGSPFRPLYNETVLFSGQPIALVLAETWEAARFAASLLRVDYSEEKPTTDLFQQRESAFTLAGDAFAMSLANPRGDAAHAFAASDMRHEADYFVPVEHHNPMELYASTVIWEGDGKLTVYDKTQGVQNVQRYLCGVFGARSEDIRVLSPFVGGAFGSGLRPQYEAVLAVLGAQALQRSVRLVLTRQQMYTLGYRPGTIEHLALAAKADGMLEATSHEAIAMTSQYEGFARNDTTWSGALYKSPNAKYEHKLARLDVPTPCDMRAPGAASGVYGLECAMDELAAALKLDPLEFRLRNYSDRDQNEDLPYTSKALRECYAQGAEAFGWQKRNPKPRSMRDGKELVGWGMASGVWEALQVKISARITLTSNGHAEVACATSDIGTGTYTIMTQVAADMLGLPLENISIRLGDSTLPQSPVEGGSWIAASVSHAIAEAAHAVREQLLSQANKGAHAPLAGLTAAEVTLSGGNIVSARDPSRAMSFADAMRQGGVDRCTAERSTNFSDNRQHARNTHSAIFAEVKVDEELGVIRVIRVVDAVAAGRILNTKTAHSQIMGGVVWGIGMALHEETLLDHRFGRFMNANLGEYHVR